MNAVVTGASKGIGKAIAMALAQQGFRLFLCSRKEGDLKACRDEILGHYPKGEVMIFPCDLSRKEGCAEFAQYCLSITEHLDVLVNNAGQFNPGDVSTEEEGLLEYMMSTNVYSAYHLSRALVPTMKKNQSGLIINISSVAGIQAYKHGGAYSISKFAMTGFSKNLREELKPYHIKVSTIYPGATMSESWAGSSVTAERIMEAADIAKVVVHLTQLSKQAVVEDVVMRPQLGDL